MPLRRPLAFAVLLATAWLLYQGPRRDLDLVGLILYLLTGVVAVLAFGIAVLGLRWGRPEPDFEDSSGFGMHPPTGRALGLIGLLLFAAAPLLIAVRGLLRGVLSPFGDGPDLVYAQAPLRFTLTLAGWLTLGLAGLWLTWQVWRANQALLARGHDQDQEQDDFAPTQPQPPRG